MRVTKILLLILTLLGVSFSAPQVARAGELFDVRGDFDRYFEFRSRSLNYYRRPFARISTAADRIINPFLSIGRGTGQNVFEDRRIAYLQAAYNHQWEMYEYQRRLVERTVREQQRRMARERATQIRNQRAQAVQLRRASVSSRSPVRGRLADDLFGGRKGGAVENDSTSEPTKLGFWNKLKSAFFD
jgi:hypothetical protein